MAWGSYVIQSTSGCFEHIHYRPSCEVDDNDSVVDINWLSK